MDLTALLLRVAARRPHVLVVPTPGGSHVRFALEAEIARRRWPTAATPADTNLLVVAGAPGPAMASVVGAVWAQVPAPRVTAVVVGVDDVAGALDAAARALADGDQQRAAARSAHPTDTFDARVDGAGDADDARLLHGHHGGHGGHGGHAPDGHDVGHHGHRAGPVEHGEHVSAERDAVGGHVDHDPHLARGQNESESGHAEPGEGHEGHGGREGHARHSDGSGQSRHGGHGGHHGHHGSGMPLPGGLAMADLGDDRDGLTLDRLHVALGPVLPDWPAGLVVRVTLQGDVIQEASAEVFDPVPDGQHHRHHREGAAAVDPATLELDGLARFLAVAGWADAAVRCRRLRDRLLAHGPNDQVTGDALALLARVRRSWVLRWSLQGLRAGDRELTDLLEQRLDRVHGALQGTPAEPSTTPGVAALPALLVGAELAAARLIVAAADPRTETLRREEVAHG